jgi:16S rRNA (cytidine1402-2'-O)-methyltransferase
VSVIAAEDTRTTGRLLQHHAIDTPLISYHDFSDERRLHELLDQLVRADVALVSDAGMPGLSDPGYRLVQAAHEAGIQVSPIPGPAAAITALVSSGLPTDAFLFLGFLPRQASARRTVLAEVRDLPYTLVLYEAPHRLLKLLADVEAVLGDRLLVVARELTKHYEEIWRGPASAAQQHFGADRIRGEITVVISGTREEGSVWDEPAVRAALREAIAQGQPRKQAAAAVAELSGWRKKVLYELSLQLD